MGKSSRTVFLVFMAFLLAYVTLWTSIVQASIALQSQNAPSPLNEFLDSNHEKSESNNPSTTNHETTLTNSGLGEPGDDVIKQDNLPMDFVPRVYKRGSWDMAPIVVEEYKLLFFTQGKVACTEFKKLLRRMMNYEDWDVHKEPKLPHDPMYNGLKYSYHYPLPKALEMMTDPEWTRAIFVRHPKERFLSAFLDKAAKKEGKYVDRHCCPNQIGMKSSCGKIASKSIANFISIVAKQCCCDAHWKPQYRRIDNELWKYVNFVGYFNKLAEDSQELLQRLGGGAWEKFGESGWGNYHNESIFAESSSSKHRTGARTKMMQYFNDSDVEATVDAFYADDYAHFNFTPFEV